MLQKKKSLVAEYNQYISIPLTLANIHKSSWIVSGWKPANVIRQIFCKNIQAVGHDRKQWPPLFLELKCNCDEWQWASAWLHTFTPYIKIKREKKDNRWVCKELHCHCYDLNITLVLWPFPWWACTSWEEDGAHHDSLKLSCWIVSFLPFKAE